MAQQQGLRSRKCLYRKFDQSLVTTGMGIRPEALARVSARERGREQHSHTRNPTYGDDFKGGRVYV